MFNVVTCKDDFVETGTEGASDARLCVWWWAVMRLRAHLGSGVSSLLTSFHNITSSSKLPPLGPHIPTPPVHVYSVLWPSNDTDWTQDTCAGHHSLHHIATSLTNTGHLSHGFTAPDWLISLRKFNFNVQVAGLKMEFSSPKSLDQEKGTEYNNILKI